jgi:hypothetical protein
MNLARVTRVMEEIGERGMCLMDPSRTGIRKRLR